MNALISPLYLDLTPKMDGSEGGPRTLASAVYAQLRNDILSCTYQPGEKLLVGPLSKGFGVSTVAVREALSRLVAHGLVVAEDQRGFHVSPLSLADLRDVTHTRIELECLALRRSIARSDAAWRTALKQAWLDLEAAPGYASGSDHRRHEIWSRMHGRFHSALVDACGLDWLMKFRTILYEQSERYRRLSRTIMRAERDTRSEHLAIFEATMRGDADLAAAEVARHFERTAEMIIEVYADCSQSETLSSQRTS